MVEKMNYVFLNEIGKKMNSASVARFQSEVKDFIDRKSDTLFLAGPSKRLYFSDTERSRFYPLLGTTQSDIIRCKKLTPVKDGWYKLDSDFNILMALAISNFQRQNKMKEVQSACTMMALSMYASLHSKYFKYEPNENIMNYTINNLSNKFKIKQFGNLFKTIVYTVTSTHETYASEIADGSDENIRKYIIAVHTRLNGFLFKIAQEFYKNHKEGKYLNTEEDNYSDENFYIADNNSLLINRTAENATFAMINKGLDVRLANIAANIGQISSSALRNAINSIISDCDDEIKDFITLILQLYLEGGENPPESIRSKRFINFCLEIYIKSNTNDASILKIKEILDRWLVKCSPNYNKTERIATKNNFRKSLFIYFILIIQQSYSSGK